MKLDTFSTQMEAMGFKPSGSSAYGITQGFPCVVTALNGSHWRFTWRAPVSGRKAEKELRRELRRNFGRGSSFIYEDGCLQVVASVTESNCREVFESVSALAVSIFRQQGISPEESCPFCGLGDCDGYAGYKRWYSPVHIKCVREMGSNEKARAQYAAASGSTASGILGALAGGIIGMLLPLLSIVLTTVFYRPLLIDALFLLMPFCVYKGYELLGGRRSKAAIPLTVAGSVIFVFLTEIIYTAVLFSHTYSIPYTSLPILAGLIMRTGDVWLAMLKASVLALAFCLIGLIFFWNSITYTVQAKMKSIRQIMDTVTEKAQPDTSFYGYSDDDEDNEDAAAEYGVSVGIRTEGDIIPPPSPAIPETPPDPPEPYEADFPEEDAVDDLDSTQGF